MMTGPEVLSGDKGVDRLFVLDPAGNRVFSVNPDGSDKKVLVTECRIPDGIAVDAEAGHIYCPTWASRI